MLTTIGSIKLFDDILSYLAGDVKYIQFDWVARCLCKFYFYSYQSSCIQMKFLKTI